MNINLILIFLITHWFADFYCQTNNMAVNKSKSNEWLSRHVLVYGLIWTTVIFTLGYFLGMEFWKLNLFMVFNIVAHWITDYFTSRWSSRLWKEERVHDFFVVIGLDQVIHYTCLFGSWVYVFNN